MKKIILAISLFCLSGQSFALQNGVITSGAKAAAGVVASTISAQVATNAVLSRNLSISALSANGAMLRRMASPAGLALTAALLALGYYLDGVLKKEPSANYPYGNGNCAYGISPTTLENCRDSFKACCIGPTGTIYDITKDASGWYRVRYLNHSWGAENTTNLWIPGFTDSNPTGAIVTPPVPATQNETTLAREQQTAMSPRNILTDAGIADRQVPEISSSLDDMEDDYQKATDTNVDGSPNTATQPDTDAATGDTGVNSQTQNMPPVTDTETATSTSQTDCQLFPNAIGCAATDYILDDYTNPGPTELDTLVLPFNFTPTMSSAGSCPAPLSDSLTSGQVVEFKFDTLCNAASMLRPLVIAIAYLLAAYMVAGYVRGASDA